MKVFISWSGELSHKIALLLKEWLQDVIQSIEPYVSSEDVEKGTRWFSDISVNLEDTDFGIICLTPENLNAPWILFEAGALSKSIDKSRVCPFLIKLSPSDLVDPLSQFQACTSKKDDMLKLLQTMNNAIQDKPLEESKLKKSFERCWSDFEKNLTKAKNTITVPEKITRPKDEILDEVLQLCRSISQAVQTPAGYKLTQTDKSYYEKKYRESLIHEVITIALKLGGKHASASIFNNTIELIAVEGTISQVLKKTLKSFANNRGYDFRIREIPTNDSVISIKEV